MEQTKLYDFYKKHVPQNLGDLIGQCTNKIDHIRESIILTNRSISHIPFTKTKIPFKTEIPEKNERLDFVFNETIISPPRVSPQLLQQCSHLYQYIHQNPADLFNGLVTIKGSPLYYFVINSSIPSLCGFFSSQEHMQIAFSFYAQVLLISDRKIATEILFPLFNTSSSYKFIEKVMSPLYTNIVIERNQKSKTTTDSDYLVNLITAAAPLLPYKTFLILMRQNWGVNGTRNFILNDFIRPLAHYWLVANDFDINVKFIDGIIDSLLKDKEKSSKMVSKIIDEKSLMELPSMFTAFNNPYFLFLATQKDFTSLIKVMSIKKDLPQSISTNYAKTKLVHAAFWIKIFPKRSMPRAQKNRPLVFSQKEEVQTAMSTDIERVWRRISSDAEDAGQIPFDYINDNKDFKNISPVLRSVTLANSILMLQNSGDTFEFLMQIMLNQKELEKWRKIAELHLKLVSSPVATQETLTIAQKFSHKRLNVAFDKSIHLFSNRLTQQCQYLRLVQLYLPYIISNLKIEEKLNEIRMWWSDLIGKKKDEMDGMISFKSEFVHSLFMDCVLKLTAIASNNLHHMFSTVMEILCIFNNLVRTMNVTCGQQNVSDIVEVGKLIGKAAVLAQSDGLIDAYIIIGSLCMDEQTFKDLCTADEQHNWCSIEAQMFVFMNDDIEMAEKITYVQEELRSIEKE